MRYFIGTWLLYAMAYLGGDIIIASIWIGAAYGFIDLMKESECEFLGRILESSHYRNW